jgi:hypothetical protein
VADKSLISRREFLKSSAAAGGSVASLSHAPGGLRLNQTAKSSTEASGETYYPSPERKNGWRIYEGGGGVKGKMLMVRIERLSNGSPHDGIVRKRIGPQFPLCASAPFSFPCSQRASAHSSIRSRRPGCRFAAGSVLIRRERSMFRPCASRGALPNLFYGRPLPLSMQGVPPAVEGDHHQLAGQGHGCAAGSVPVPLPLVEAVKSRTQRRPMRRLHQRPAQYARSLLGGWRRFALCRVCVLAKREDFAFLHSTRPFAATAATLGCLVHPSSFTIHNSLFRAILTPLSFAKRRL